jgi:DNA invertase Pin-like site-specific DNA recombinase
MKRDEGKIVLRCAVYTRVSTDSGLEQDFNSLDNQREASEAYIKSQAHEGWRLAREHLTMAASQGVRWSARRSRSCWRMLRPVRST